MLKVPAPARLPASGYVDYRYFVLPYRFDEDTWVEAIEIRADNKRVLHHANLAHFKLGEDFSNVLFGPSCVGGLFGRFVDNLRLLIGKRFQVGFQLLQPLALGGQFLRALVVYNSSLTNLERAKGTLLQQEGIGVERVEDDASLPLVQLVKQEATNQAVSNYEIQK